MPLLHFEELGMPEARVCNGTIDSAAALQRVGRAHLGRLNQGTADGLWKAPGDFRFF
jgi:hypothetical protein